MAYLCIHDVLHVGGPTVLSHRPRGSSLPRALRWIVFSPTGQHESGVQVLAGIAIALHDAPDRGVLNSKGFLCP